MPLIVIAGDTVGELVTGEIAVDGGDVVVRVCGIVVKVVAGMLVAVGIIVVEGMVVAPVIMACSPTRLIS